MIDECKSKQIISRFICNTTAKFVDRIVKRLGNPFYKIAQFEFCGWRTIFDE